MEQKDSWQQRELDDVYTRLKFPLDGRFPPPWITTWIIVALIIAFMTREGEEGTGKYIAHVTQSVLYVCFLSSLSVGHVFHVSLP